VRYGTLIGSATVVLLLVAAGAVVFRGDGSPRSDQPRPKETTAAQSEPALALAKPTEVERAAPPAAPVPPSFDVVKVGPTGVAVIAGRAEPGAKVIVRDGEKAIGEVTSDQRGEWVLIPAQPIGPGDRLLSAEASTPGSGATVKSQETVALSISPAGRAGETALAVVLPHEGEGAARVLQLPSGNSAEKPNSISMDTAEYDTQGRVVLSGRAAPGATVQIYLGNQPLATVTADAAGKWSAASSQAVPPGQLELRLDQLAPSGQVAQRVALPFSQATPIDPAPGQNYVVQRGNNLWRIAQRAYGAGTRYVVIYSANPDQIRNPDKIYPGQVFKIPKS
jgi:nucleoid-associated protein YgaU